MYIQHTHAVSLSNSEQPALTFAQCKSRPALKRLLGPDDLQHYLPLRLFVYSNVSIPFQRLISDIHSPLPCLVSTFLLSFFSSMSYFLSLSLRWISWTFLVSITDFLCKPSGSLGHISHDYFFMRSSLRSRQRLNKLIEITCAALLASLQSRPERDNLAICSGRARSRGLLDFWLLRHEPPSKICCLYDITKGLTLCLYFFFAKP
jgi:hypothetical protein